MADYLPVMLSVNHPHPDLEQWVVERFERLNNRKVFIVTKEMLPKEALLGHPAYAKAWLWDVLPDTVDRFLFLDYDVVPMRSLPEIPDVPFVAVPDVQWWINTMKKRYPLFAKTQKYFNSGFFVARRDTRTCFDKLKAFIVSESDSGPYKNTYEQTPLNHLIQSAFDVHWLPITCNCMVHSHYDEAASAHMLHLTGMPNQSRWTIMALFKMLLGTDPIQGS